MTMQYHTRIKTIFMILALALACPGAHASQAETRPTSPRTRLFAVLPIKVNGPQKFRYLSKGIQDMLLTRLNWEGHFEPANNFTALQSSPGPIQARDMLKKNGLDFLIWGSLTLLGQDASLDLNILTAKNQLKTENIQTKLDRLLPALNSLAQRISYKIFQNRKVPPSASQSGPASTSPVQGPPNAGNPRQTQGQYYLNPQFRYENRNISQGQWRSRSLPFASTGMAVCDADGDGQNEIFFLLAHKVLAYKIKDNGLVRLGEKRFSQQRTLLMINALDLERDGKTELIICGVEDLHPVSTVLGFKNGTFSTRYKKIPLFLNVLRTPPDFSRSLVGQQGGNGELFSPGIYEVRLESKGFGLGKRFLLPEHSTIFNCTFFPTKDDYLTLISKSNQPLQVYSSTAEILAKSREIYSGSGNRVQVPNSLPGLGKNLQDPTEFYYLPLRRLVCNLDQDDRFELLISHNISLSSKIFARYRSFPEGEIHALGWDGTGMTLIWKTRTLQGGITDFSLADVNNDGEQDLAVCLNTYPGLAGLGRIKTILLAYPLKKQHK